ncbi:H-type lectin domain-containing protein [Rhodobacter sp.]
MAMKRVGSGIGILQGSRVLFSDFADGGMMWTGNGNRECRFLVGFKPPFSAVPAVTVGISMWDMDHKTNSRADITAENITEKGFHIVFRTWGDTRVARVRADWMAIGAVRDEDDWDVA